MGQLVHKDGFAPTRIAGTVDYNGWFKSGKSYKTNIFTLLRPDSESFGKWCLEKCNFFFISSALMPA